MNISEKHLKFIPRIYDAALDPTQFQEILNTFASYSGADGASLMLGDNIYPEISTLVVTSSMDQRSLGEYTRLHGPADAKALSIVSQYPPHTWISEETAFGENADQIAGNIWQRENWGLDRRIAARLSHTPLWLDAISLNYNIGRDIISDEENAISQIFLPHLSKAIELSRSFLLLRQRFNAVLTVLDHLKIGILICDQHGEVVISNEKAQSAFDAKNGLSLSSAKKLTVFPNTLQQHLNKKISAATHTPHETNADSVFPVPKKKGIFPWILEIFPLSTFDNSIEKSFEGAVIFLTDPEQKDLISTKGMKKIFGLSTAESAVCALLTQGYKIHEIAEQRGVSPGTVKGQVSNLFMKTTTNSQIDLIRLALKVNLPVENIET